jgi:hypothetical protein
VLELLYKSEARASYEKTMRGLREVVLINFVSVLLRLCIFFAVVTPSLAEHERRS